MAELGSDDERRVEELSRVNAELAAEIRSLNLNRRASPRLGPLPASRRLASLMTELDTTAAERDVANRDLADLQQEREELLRRIGELEQETIRLRSGFAGLLRRLRARVLRF
jgi:predicted  nucleic acid-binding Zn-ribbon protein